MILVILLSKKGILYETTYFACNRRSRQGYR